LPYKRKKRHFFAVGAQTRIIYHPPEKRRTNSRILLKNEFAPVSEIGLKLLLTFVKQSLIMMPRSNTEKEQ